MQICTWKQTRHANAFLFTPHLSLALHRAFPPGFGDAASVPASLRQMPWPDTNFGPMETKRKTEGSVETSSGLQP